MLSCSPNVPVWSRWWASHLPSKEWPAGEFLRKNTAGLIMLHATHARGTLSLS